MRKLPGEMLRIIISRFFAASWIIIVLSVIGLFLFPTMTVIAESNGDQDAAQKFTITVHAHPAGARLFVNDQDYGIVPQTLMLAGGEYTFRLEARRLVPFRQNVLIAHHETLNFELSRKVGTVFFDSDPPGAQIIIDGIDFGFTPRSVRLYYGPHDIQYKHEQYEWHTLQFEVWDDFTMNLPFTNFLEPAFLTIPEDPVFPAGEDVMLNGEVIGKTPIAHYPVYGSPLQISVSGISKELEFESGQSYTLVPRTPIPPVAPAGSISLPGYIHIDKQPEVLPEERISDREETIRSLNREVLVFGTSAAILSGLGIFAVSRTRSENIQLSAGIGAGVGLFTQLVVLVSSRQKEIIPAFTPIPLKSNVRKNERALRTWERQSAAAIQANSQLIEEMNQARGEWDINVEPASFD
ncbi:PEGA domain-containing protein [Spirochaeta dissipatitropha]